MDNTTLIILILVILIVFGGSRYVGRWYYDPT